MPAEEVSKLWVMIMDEYQHIENIEGFYHYITNTWRDQLILYDGMRLCVILVSRKVKRIF